MVSIDYVASSHRSFSCNWNLANGKPRSRSVNSKINKSTKETLPKRVSISSSCCELHDDNVDCHNENPSTDMTTRDLTTEVLRTCATQISNLNRDPSLSIIEYAARRRRFIIIIIIVLFIRMFNEQAEEEAIEEDRRAQVKFEMKERVSRMRHRHQIRLRRIRERAPGKHFAGQDL